MIQNKTILIAHNWSNRSVNYQSKKLAEQLCLKNHVIFLNARKQGEKLLRINEHLEVFEWPNKRPTGVRDILFAIQVMLRYKPDLVITNFAANNAILVASTLTGVKQRICYYHTMVAQHIADAGRLSARQKFNIFRKGILFRKATHMLPCSSAAKEDLIKYYAVHAEKAHVFPNALPDTNLRNNSNHYTVGFLGRLDPSKGADILIEAFEKVLSIVPQARLTIVGSGKQYGGLQQMLAKKNLNDSIDLAGPIPYNAVASFVSSVSFLVVPSRTDNLPTVALEAFSTGTPVIGSNSGGIPDIIQHGSNGLLFEPGNIEDLAEKISYLLEAHEARRSMGLIARKTFEERYSTDQLLERFTRLIDQG